ncbi:MAG: flavin reductase family protein [Solirubrobacterales bacterium]
MSKTAFKGSAMLNPVPAVLITSKMGDKVNVFTAAWVGTACTKPAMITVSIRPERLSYDFICASKEMTINLPTRKIVRAVDFCGVKSGRDVDKIEACSFTLEEGVLIDVPSIKECPVSMECKVKDIIPLGSHDLFLAEVLQVNVDNKIIHKDGKIHFEEADLICYSHGEYFSIENSPLGKFGYSIKKRRGKK